MQVPKAFAPDEFTLMTLTVNSTHATFYHNLDVVATSELKRPVTDCFNNFEGVLIGDAGLEMGQLRFYPRRLQASDVEEIYNFGSRLSDMSTGSQVTQASLAAIPICLNPKP